MRMIVEMSSVSFWPWKSCLGQEAALEGQGDRSVQSVLRANPAPDELIDPCFLIEQVVCVR